MCRPGDIAVVFRPHFFLDGPADDIGVQKEVFKGGFQHIIVHFSEDVHEQLMHIVVRVIDDCAECVPLYKETVGAVSSQPVHPFHQLGEVMLRILFDVAIGGFQAELAQCFWDHSDSPFLSFLNLPSETKRITLNNYKCKTLCISTEFLPKLSAVLMLGDCAMKAKKELNIQIGERIKRAREKGGMTQEQFAELINKTPQFVSDLERGVSGISIETLRTICEKLCISSDSILFARRDENDVSELTSKFRKMSHVKFRALEQIVNALLYTEAEIGSDQ